MLWLVSAHPKPAGVGAGLWCPRAVPSTISGCCASSSMGRKALHLRIVNLLPRQRNSSSTFLPMTSLLLCGWNDEWQVLVNVVGKLVFSLNLRFLLSGKICHHQVFADTLFLSEYSHRILLKVLSLYFETRVLKFL